MTPAATSGSSDPNPGVSAVILSGGGANGAYEVGVLKALYGGASSSTGYRPLNAGIFTGTSIGAFNATVMVSRLQGGDQTATQGGLVAAKQLEDIWLNVIPRDDSTAHNHVYRFRGDPLEFFNPALIYQNPIAPIKGATSDAVFFLQTLIGSLAIVTAPGSKNLIARIASSIDFSAFIDNEPTVRLVQQSIDPRVIRESATKLRIAATNWNAGKVDVFENADMTDDYAVRIVLSSTAMPGLFPPVSMDGVTYVDGGVLENTPLKPAIRAGAHTLHVIYLDPAVSSIPLNGLSSTLDTMTRMFVVQFAASMNADIKRVAMINRGIATASHAAPLLEESGPLLEKVSKVLDVPQILKLQPLVVHRYHPREDLGGGILGWLDFSRHRNQRLIDRGFQDAAEHDCDRSGCVLADGTIRSHVSG
jgi:NTE family protein